VLSGEATNNNFIVFGLTRSGLQPTMYHTQGEHANHYTNFDPDMTCFRDIKDETILKYSDKLIQNYKEVVKNTLHLFVPQNKLHKYSTE
jgi:hypothetical protein